MNIINWYLNTSFHKWWVEKVWKPSWSKFTSLLYGIPASLVAVGEVASKFANDNTIQGYLLQINVPNWVPMGLAGIALVHYVASGRED